MFLQGAQHLPSVLWSTFITWNITDQLRQFFILLVQLLIWNLAVRVLNLLRFDCGMWIRLLCFYLRSRIWFFRAVLYLMVICFDKRVRQFACSSHFSGTYLPSGWGRGNFIIYMGCSVHVWYLEAWKCRFWFGLWFYKVHVLLSYSITIMHAWLWDPLFMQIYHY